MHGLIGLAVISVVVIGGLNRSEIKSYASEQPQAASSLDQLVGDGYGGLVDKTASAYIAAEVAEKVDLPVSEDVTKRAQDLSNQVTLASSGESYLNKPQVVNTDAKSRHEIQSYTVAAGDTVASIAQKFGLTENTVRWANNLTGASQPQPGQQLIILPVNGVLHTVSATDTPEGLALIYKANAQQIVSFNDAEVDGLKPGSRIVIPDGVIQQTTPAPSFSAANNSFVTSAGFTPSYGGNGYDYGWCTWHAANRRAAAGRPIPSNWGNAISWRYNAVSSGFAVGSTPQPGAVVYHKNIGGWGHVAYVERLTADGAWFSDMNYPIWGRVTERFIPAGEFGNYSFIY